MTVCIREYTPALSPEEDTVCIEMTMWAPLTVTCVSFGLNFFFLIHCYLETLHHLGHIASRVFGCIPEGFVFLIVV